MHDSMIKYFILKMLITPPVGRNGTPNCLRCSWCRCCAMTCIWASISRLCFSIFLPLLLNRQSPIFNAQSLFLHFYQLLVAVLLLNISRAFSDRLLLCRFFVMFRLLVERCCRIIKFENVLLKNSVIIIFINLILTDLFIIFLRNIKVMKIFTLKAIICMW